MGAPAQLAAVCNSFFSFFFFVKDINKYFFFVQKTWNFNQKGWCWFSLLSSGGTPLSSDAQYLAQIGRCATRVHSWIWIMYAGRAALQFTCPPPDRVRVIFGAFSPLQRVYRVRNIDDAIISISKRVLFYIFDTFVETDGACRLLFAQFQWDPRAHVRIVNNMIHKARAPVTTAMGLLRKQPFSDNARCTQHRCFHNSDVFVWNSI